ncbi:MAG: uncharacterized protein JWL77_6967, partial [Chthonomonadaceae bacterium]|nr:uncharacterized protein [Chthonomonadaceae bacterium]
MSTKNKSKGTKLPDTSSSSGPSSAINSTDSSKPSDPNQSSFYTPTQGLNGLYGNTSMPTTLPATHKLTGTDPAAFADWKSKFKAYCLMQGLSEVVFKPADEAFKLAKLMNHSNKDENLLMALFKSLHSKAFGAIMSSVDSVTGSAFFNEIEAEQEAASDSNEFINYNANYLWVKLCSQYEKKTLHTAVSVWKQLLSLTYKDGENPIIFKKKFDTLILQLNQIDDVILKGQKISEGFKAVIWLNSLPPVLDSTTQSLLIKPKVSHEEIYNALVVRFESNGNSNPKSSKSKLSSPETATANAAITHEKKDRDPRDQKKRNPSRSGKPPRNKDRTPGARCNYCLLNNHTEAQCFVKKRDEAKGKDTSEEHSSCFYEEHNSDTEIEREQFPNHVEIEQEYLQDEIANATISSDLFVGNPNQFLLDSASTRHITPHKKLLENIHSIPGVRLTSALKSSSALIDKAGTIRLNPNYRLNEVAYVPGAGPNLISEAKIADAGYQILKNKICARILDSKGKVILTFPRANKLWMYTTQPTKPPVGEKPTLAQI